MVLSAAHLRQFEERGAPSTPSGQRWWDSTASRSLTTVHVAMGAAAQASDARSQARRRCPIRPAPSTWRPAKPATCICATLCSFTRRAGHTAARRRAISASRQYHCPAVWTSMRPQDRYRWWAPPSGMRWMRPRLVFVTSAGAERRRLASRPLLPCVPARARSESALGELPHAGHDRRCWPVLCRRVAGRL